jgi:TetR/AcrR family transcriptional regulator
VKATTPLAGCTFSSSRADQREDTRNPIIEAAARTFSERGFPAANTREIATRAGANQGLITYHFRRKLELWKAAADRIFVSLRASFEQSVDVTAMEDGRAMAHEAIRQFVRFNAARPEPLRFMVEEGKHTDACMRWLVDTHLELLYRGFDRALVPHAYYALAGAASVMFAVAPECRRLTGINPAAKEAVGAHVEFVARSLVP